MTAVITTATTVNQYLHIKLLLLILMQKRIFKGQLHYLYIFYFPQV